MEEINARKSSGIVYISFEGKTYAITENKWPAFVSAYRRGEGRKFLEANKIQKTLHSLIRLWKELGRKVE